MNFRIEILKQILYYCDRNTLRKCVLLSKDVSEMIQNDRFLSAQFNKIEKWIEFVRYLSRIGATFYGVDFYTEIGQATKAKFPYVRYFKKFKI